MKPLSHLLRPKTLSGFVGQNHLIGPDGPLFALAQQGKLVSMIFRGPPGCGKTTLAQILAHYIQGDFFSLSGVESKKQDLHHILEHAQQNHLYGKTTILFLDEIHRRNKAQQDALLPHVEQGTITLIGASTENPSFTVINALLSRCRVFVFDRLEVQDISDFFHNKLPEIQTIYPQITFDKDLFQTLGTLGNGDLRMSINLLETALLQKNSGLLTKEDLLKAGAQLLQYDRNGEQHYDIISAIHKSLRDSDPDAACYWIQRMLMGGEDPLYLARRLLRFASEDIGPADNNALLLANQVYDAIAKVGMPECKVFLFQLALYLAKAPKNNITEKIDHETRADVERYGNLPVPLVIRNAPTQLMKDLNYGKGYQYAHDMPDHKTTNQHFPDELIGRHYGK